jgi:fatty-acyl-CoA synthase
VELLEFVNASPDAIDPAVRSRIGLDDPLFYIYTSGTTGPSKAALFSHRRFIGAGLTWSRPMGLTHLDKYYVTLPLFHGNGGVVAVSAAWKAGCCVVIRSGFSVSNWWGDIIRHGCTATIYIGELWRYLYNQPPAPEERAHKLRVAAGNGLRPDIWMAVRRRFGVQRIVEHYGMTEMPAGPYMNAYGRPGACGYIPPAVRRAERHDELIRFDLDQNRPMLGKDGLCIACEDGQVGEAIFRLRQPYVGYTDPRASARRVYRDVFEKGDEWFATGDLLRRDAEGFFYFVDRMGDSFRWKGENVSTNEVSEVVAAFPGVLEANVYGVRFPPREGRPGMASVFVTVPADQFDWAAFYRHVQVLPHFAQPLFVRVRHQENDKTATFKFQKFRFEREGFDPDLVPASEPVFFRDDRPGVRSYVPLTRELHAMIMNEQFRV